GIGTVGFTYTVSDGALSANGSASLTVRPVNDAPTTTPVTLPDMAEDSGSVTITSAQLLANAHDVDSTTLSVTGVSATTGSVVANADGTWTYTPVRDFNGAVDFT